jgi:hypothetical protein
MEKGKERPRGARSRQKSVKNEPGQGQPATAGVRHEPGFPPCPVADQDQLTLGR